MYRFAATAAAAWGLSCVAAGAIASPVSFASGGDREGSPAEVARPCQRHALALRQSAIEIARGEYRRELALGIDELGAVPSRIERAARARLRESLTAVERIYRARLEVCAVIGPGPYDPILLPAEFSAVVDHVFHPLVPGRTLVYERDGAKGFEVIEVSALAETEVIDGIECRVVHTSERVDQELVEETREWYAQHVSGALWYLGERARHYENGQLVSLGGSWQSGEHGAEAGTQLESVPTPAGSHRKAHAPDEDEDILTVLSTNETVVTAGATYTGCVKIEEWSPLEGEREHKYFAPGIGLVLEIDVATGERTELVDVRQAPVGSSR